MKIYISCHEPSRANELADRLVAAGRKVTSEWHRTADRPNRTDGAAWADCADRNFAAVREADAFVMIACPGHIDGSDRVPGGKFVELGFALGQWKRRTYIIGGAENGMCHARWIAHVKSDEEFLIAIGGSA